MWFYETPIGAVQIKANSTGKYIILFDDEWYGPYLTPGQALDDLICGETGCSELDFNETLRLAIPSTLSEWHHR